MIRKVEEKDLDIVDELFNEGREYFRKHGINQWQSEPGGYPSKNDVKKDMENSGGYVAVEDDMVIGYSYINELDEKNYHYIEGDWLNDEPYVVVHRTCVSNACKGKGVGSLFFEKAKEICVNKGLHSIRVDTHQDNLSMQRLLEKNGFIKCGIIYVQDGSPRYAYQLLV